ncbi:MAG: serine/threonine-protein kinase [Bryobacterales bacterium]|nr:serine/threonine-protein kinase [Bryobacterales bacterium]
MSLIPGTRIGPYEILAEIGEGGMGKVFRGRDTRLDRVVAVKVMTQDRTNNPDMQRRFQQEARAVSALNHPNICALFDVGEYNSCAYLVMEYIDGETLASRLRRGPLAVDEALGYARQILAALEHAHGKGIIHRDLKPANIMLVGSGNQCSAKLLDFGLAKALPSRDGEASLDEKTEILNTDPEHIVGTPAYLPPEVLRGQPADVRSDLHSFGAVLYEMLTARRAFAATGKGDVYAAILRDEVAPLSQFRDDVPRALEWILRRCLAKTPADRWQTAADLGAALDMGTSGSERRAVDPTPAPAPAPAPGAAGRLWRRPAVHFALGVLAIATALAAWAFYVSSQRRGISIESTATLTFDPGIAAWPAISPDGKLLAFSSDRGELGNMDIWIRQMAGGSPIRLTSLPGAEVSPGFSPDGTAVCFLAGDSAIYEVPALGGPPRPVIENAGPFSISPKGDLLFVRTPVGSRLGSMFSVPLQGGVPQPWQPGCRTFSRPAFSSDGGRVIFAGDCGSQTKPGWYVAPFPEGVAKLVHPYTGAGLPNMAAAWATGDRVLLQERIAGPLLGLDFHGPPVPVLNESDSVPLQPAAGPDGMVAFASARGNHSVRRVSLPDNAVAAKGDPTVLAAAMGHFGVSRDGRVLVYGRLTGDNSELVVQNLDTGEQRGLPNHVFAAHPLVGASFGSLWPQVSPDGTRVFYRVIGANGGHYLLDLRSRTVTPAATMKEFNLGSDWSPNGERVIGECPPPGNGICEWNSLSRTVRTLAVQPKESLLYPSYAWDGKSVVFMRRRPGMLTAIWTSPVRPDGTLASPNQWKELSEPGTENSRPRLSPDGSVVYYVTARGGQRLLVARRGTASAPVVLVKEPLETPLISGGFGPYPLLHVTRGRIYYSTIGFSGNLTSVKFK